MKLPSPVSATVAADEQAGLIVTGNNDTRIGPAKISDARGISFATKIDSCEIRSAINVDI